MGKRGRNASAVADARAANVLVTGTPGTGKTTLAARLAEATGLEHVDVGAVVKAHQATLSEGRDEHNDAFILDEDALLDHLEPRVGGLGGCVVDHHSSDFYPERWFDRVVVLTCDNTVLYNRLAARGYAAHKITENVQHEIMQCAVEEAREAYGADIVDIRPSETDAHMNANLADLVAWVTRWRQEHLHAAGAPAS